LDLGDGRRLWAFADTWLGVIQGRRKIARVLRSSGALQIDTNSCGPLRYLRDNTGAPRQLIPMRPGDDESRVAHWPLALVCEGDRVIAFYQRIRLHGDSVAQINFSFLGVGIAAASIADFAFHLDCQGELLFSAEEYGFFDAVLPSETYLYGLGCPPRPGSLRRPCRLGRVLRGAEARRSAYEVWDGKSWNYDISRAAEVLDAGSPEMSLLRGVA